MPLDGSDKLDFGGLCPLVHDLADDCSSHKSSFGFLPIMFVVVAVVFCVSPPPPFSLPSYSIQWRSGLLTDEKKGMCDILQLLS